MNDKHEGVQVFSRLFEIFKDSPRTLLPDISWIQNIIIVIVLDLTDIGHQ